MFTVRSRHCVNPQGLLRRVHVRDILRALRAMTDGPYMGWKPTTDDWYRIRFGSVLYVDKDGLLSSIETNRGARPKFRASGKHDKDAQPPPSDPRRQTYPMGGPMGNDDPGALRQMFGIGGAAGQPEDLPPADFYMNSPSFSDSSATSSPSEFGGPTGTDEIHGISGGINEARIKGGDSSSMLPMELMIYNDLMMDIGGTARFLGQEFQDSVLFGSTPTSSPVPAGQCPGQGPKPQLPNSMYGCVFFLQSLRSSWILTTARFWESKLYDNFLDQISKQAM